MVYAHSYASQGGAKELGFHSWLVLARIHYHFLHGSPRTLTGCMSGWFLLSEYEKQRPRARITETVAKIWALRTGAFKGEWDVSSVCMGIRRIFGQVIGIHSSTPA